MWNNKKSMFKRKKNIFYKKKKRNVRDIFLITTLVFLAGMMISLILIEDKNVNSMTKKDSELQSENYDSPKVIEAQKAESDKEIEGSILSEDEVNLIKEAVDKDFDGLFKLVNKENILSEEYYPKDLIVPNVQLQLSENNEQSSVRDDMKEDIEKMFADAKAEGIELFLNSGFRGYDLQSALYDKDIREHGEGGSDYVAMPGASEHQLGLAVDITSASVGFQLIEDFKDTKEGRWILDNAYKYGFILRYGENKEKITGYKYESWHFRYIGNKDISKMCYDKDLTLEEILNFIKNE